MIKAGFVFWDGPLIKKMMPDGKIKALNRFDTRR